MTTRFYNWCFTLNNYTSNNYDDILNIKNKYLIVGKEIGECGTPHLQGFCQFKNPLIKPPLPGHYEPCKGTPAQNIAYCSKEGKFLEFGVRPMDQQSKGKAEKRRWEDARTAAKEGRLDDVPADIYVRNYSTIKRIALDHQKKPVDVSSLDNEWIHGVTGCGKSKSVRERFPDAYIKNQNKWWCGYQGEETVIIDDLHQSWVGVTALKTWADHYAFMAEHKGGSSYIRPKRIIVTSNYIPEEVFLNRNDLEPILRRFNVINMSPEKDTSYAPIFNVNKKIK